MMKTLSELGYTNISCDKEESCFIKRLPKLKRLPILNRGRKQFIVIKIDRKSGNVKKQIICEYDFVNEDLTTDELNAVSKLITEGKE